MGPPGADHTVEIGYSVIPDRRGRGYATEATRALVRWALGQPQVEVVVAGCDIENAPSIRILERTGFVRTGETNGEVRWRVETAHD
jgi:ribosomal-protein-alanine N-acetyltransferase